MSTTAAASGSTKNFVQFPSTTNDSLLSAISSTSNVSSAEPGGFIAGTLSGSGIVSGRILIGGCGGGGGIVGAAGGGGVVGGGGIVENFESDIGGRRGIISGIKELVHQYQMNQNLPPLKPDLLLNDTGLFTVYCFIKNFIGASGTSAVAIDNKIEQAMDLVKSHLMIAVREEVEVLKEKIAELMDRINQLELENTILKANVSQETLSQLSATLQTATTKPPQNANPSNGPGS